MIVCPKTKPSESGSVAEIGEDGYFLLDCIEPAPELGWLKQLPAVQAFAQVWMQHYRGDQGPVQRLTPTEMLPVGEWIRSPYDPEVRFGKKREFEWVGSKVHLTECCDDPLPHLITPVETLPALEQDQHALEAIQAEVAEQDLRPSDHLVDAGYVSAKRIVPSRDVQGLDLIGPVHNDPSWQARTPGAFDVSPVHFDWEHQQVTCPQGQQNRAWYPGKDAQGESIVLMLVAKHTRPRVPSPQALHRCPHHGTKHDGALSKRTP